MGASTALAAVTLSARRRGLPQHRGQIPNQQSEHLAAEPARSSRMKRTVTSEPLAADLVGLTAATVPAMSWMHLQPGSSGRSRPSRRRQAPGTLLRAPLADDGFGDG